MQKGTVKWFNPTKGYGFIKPMAGDKDVFVHISAVERAGLSTLNENQVVEYDLVENRGKSSAENLKVSLTSPRSCQIRMAMTPGESRGICFWGMPDQMTAGEIRLSRPIAFAVLLQRSPSSRTPPP